MSLIAKPLSTRNVTIRCFVCQKDKNVLLKQWELAKKISCPDCGGKEATIQSPY